MARWISSALSTLLLTLAATVALAAPADDAKGQLAKARESLVAMLDADASKLDGLQAEVVKASKEVDGAVAAALADKATPADKAKLYKELKTTWEAFKKTRDTEIIPALRAGKKDAAKALAKGVQAERFKKMNELLLSLGAK